jgi:hypothetical protein
MGVIRSGRRTPAPPAQAAEGVGYRFGDTQHPPLSAVSMLASLLVQTVLQQRPAPTPTESLVRELERQSVTHVNRDHAVDDLVQFVK